MDSKDFEIKHDDINMAVLEVVIHAFARQDALIFFLLKRLTDNDDEFSKETKALYKTYQKGIEKAFERIYENYGHVDLNRIFGNADNKPPDE
jgi:hypothetical protein